MRISLIIALLMLASCVRRDANNCIIQDNKVQANAQNDRARRAQYPTLSDAQYDSMAVKNCWTVVK